MADNSKIEWTDASWNPIRARFVQIQNDGSGKERLGWHCEKVSDGCRNCYAEGINRRLGTGLDYKPGNLFREEKRGYANGEAQLFLDETMLLRPLKWKRPRMIFVCSMTDLFADFVPDEWIDKLFAVMALCPQHTFQVLTKRSARMREMVTAVSRPGLPERAVGAISRLLDDGTISHEQARAAYRRPFTQLPNVWLGVSAERQAEADARIPDLLATPASVRFVSLEPLLGSIDLERIHLRVTDAKTGGLVDVANPFNAFRGQTWTTLLSGEHAGKRFYSGGSIYGRLDWVIVGGESQAGARPMHPDWARAIRDQCASAKRPGESAGVPFFFKQWGAWAPTEKALGRDASRWAVAGGHIFTERPSAHPGKLRLGRVGKKAAGRLLDGIEHNGMPAAAQRIPELAEA